MPKVAVDTTQGDAGGRRCKDCEVIKPRSEYYVSSRKDGRAKLSHVCKPCGVKRCAAYRQKDIEAFRAKYYRGEAGRRKRIKYEFGISTMFLERLEEEQGGVCAICGTLPLDSARSSFRIDHCHTTGKIRGLLCNLCNLMLGQARDNPWILLRAIRYLEETAQKEAPIARCFLKKRVAA